MLPDDPRHGTYAGGRVHRADHQPVCDPCAYAEARYERARQLDILNGRPAPCRPGHPPPLQALVALGHSFGRIGEALDMTGAGAWALGTRDRAYVRATTVAKVASLYEAWSMTLPPEITTNERKAAAYARTVATKHGWLPPLAWDDIDHDPEPAGHPTRDDVDWVVVERILAGDACPPPPPSAAPSSPAGPAPAAPRRPRPPHRLEGRALPPARHRGDRGMTSKAPRQRKTPKQRAEEALGVAERRWEQLDRQVVKARADLFNLEGEWTQAKVRLEYARQDPALKQGTSTTSSTPATS
jgi:hypothetical protein